jgi:hypothetical protein
MARNILVTEIGRDHSNDSMRYRVELGKLGKLPFMRASRKVMLS